MITFENVTKKYPDGTVAVDDLTLEVPDGTLTVFVGPSGCGKTTSMRMINRMIDPTSGTLTVNGEDVTKVDAVKLRLGIGYVIQSAGLMPHLRVVDNVATVPVLRGESRRSARKAALEVMERVGLDPKLADRYPAQLSGGQQQRVGVARALAADPPILLMDEPFSAVDPVVREDLQTEILRLQSELPQDHRVRHPRHRRGRQARRQGRGVRSGRCAAAVRRPAVRVVEPGQRTRVGLRRRRPRLSRPAVLPRDGAADCTTSGQWRSRTSTRSRSGRRSGRWSSRTATPYAWINAEGVDVHRKGSSLYDSTIGGGSFFRPDGTLRLALDAALSSPTGLGVAVDDDGQLIGGVRADDVIEALDEQRRVPEVG